MGFLYPLVFSIFSNTISSFFLSECHEPDQLYTRSCNSTEVGQVFLSQIAAVSLSNFFYCVQNGCEQKNTSVGHFDWSSVSEVTVIIALFDSGM